jgi:2-dehydropantoate 2-reductase
MTHIKPETDKMRIIIYGAGAVGGVVGGLLALSGTPVVMVGRPNNVAAIREKGLKLITAAGTHIVQLPAVTSPDQIDFNPDDVVFLCVKGQDTDSSVRDLFALVKDVPVFCFQNGVRNEEIVSKYYPRVYGVMVKAGSVFIRDGEVESRGNPPGRFVLGRYPDGTDVLLAAVAARLRNAGYEVEVTPEIMPSKYGKLVENLANAVGAITNAAGPEANRIALAAQDEGKEILARAGIRWLPAKEAARKPSNNVMPPPDSIFGRPLGSTWQSLVRNQGTVETDFLNGEIVRLAAKIGSQAPINQELLRITLEMAANHEKPGKYTPAELLKILKLV